MTRRQKHIHKGSSPDAKGRRTFELKGAMMGMMMSIPLWNDHIKRFPIPKRDPKRAWWKRDPKQLSDEAKKAIVDAYNAHVVKRATRAIKSYGEKNLESLPTHLKQKVVYMRTSGLSPDHPNRQGA
jgi:hypothetical protein